jgi:hypothetical protein
MFVLLLLSTIWLSSPSSDHTRLQESVQFLTLHLRLAEEEEMPYLLIRDGSLQFFIEGVRLEEIPVSGVTRVSGPSVQLASVDRVEIHFPERHPHLDGSYPEISLESTASVFRIHMSDGSEIVILSKYLKDALEEFLQRGKRVPLDIYLQPQFSSSSLTFVIMEEEHLHHFRHHVKAGMKILY